MLIRLELETDRDAHQAVDALAAVFGRERVRLLAMTGAAWDLYLVPAGLLDKARSDKNETQTNRVKKEDQTWTSDVLGK